jgi:NitT/TauT family transport system substrate-binding protein
MGKWSYRVLEHRSLASDNPAFLCSLLHSCFLCFLLLTPTLSQGQEERVKIGLLMINADAGIFIAKERGYFRDQGISAELIFFSSSGGPQMAALTSGELDAGSGSISPGIYNAVAGGIGLKVVATKSRVGTGRTAKYVVRRSLLEPGKQPTLKDLKGRIVALNSAGGSSRLFLDGLLKKAGLRENDVTIRVMPFTDMANALSRGAIDAAFMVQPFASAVEESGTAISVADLADFFPGHMTNNLFFSDVFIRNRPKTAERFMNGFLRGQRDFRDAVTKKKETLDEIVELVGRYLRVEDKKSLKVGLSAQDSPPNGEVNVTEIQDDQDWYFQRGFIRTKVDVDRMVDLRFLQSSVGVLGPYR